MRTLQEDILCLKKKMRKAKVEQAHAHEMECEQVESYPNFGTKSPKDIGSLHRDRG